MNARYGRTDARVVLRAVPILLLAGFFAGAIAGPLVARLALAAHRPYVTVYGDRSDPVVTRLVPELMALGCVVRIDASPATDPASPLEGDAVVRVTDTTVRLWLLDSQSAYLREGGVVGIDDRGPDGVELTALRVSEMVRAQLLPVASTPASSQGEKEAAARTADPGESAPTPAFAPTLASTHTADSAPTHVHPHPRPPRPSISLSAGPVLLLAPGGTQPAFDLALSPEWHPSRTLRVRALLAAPLTAPSIVATGGEAAVSTWLGGVAVDWQTTSRDDEWRGMVGAGTAVVFSHARGTATAPYVGSTTNAVASLPFIDVGGSRGLGRPSVRVAVDGMLGVALPEIVVQFASQRVATWGLPVVGVLSMALDVDLW
jgi:hypothetical protein